MLINLARMNQSEPLFHRQIFDSDVTGKEQVFGYFKDCKAA